MKSLLVPSTAKYIFNKIKRNLENFGYKVEFASELEKYSGQNDSYQQSIKIKGFNTTYGKVFSIKDDAPVLELRLMSYKDWNGIQQYNLWAHISGTNFDWEGENTSVQQVTDVFLEDADSGIANTYSDWDYLDFTEENETVSQLNEGLINNIDLDGLTEQVQESNDLSSLEELNVKVDTILDALGLVDEEEKEEENTDSSVNLDVADDTVDDVSDENNDTITKVEPAI